MEQVSEVELHRAAIPAVVPTKNLPPATASIKPASNATGIEKPTPKANATDVMNSEVDLNLLFPSIIIKSVMSIRRKLVATFIIKVVTKDKVLEKDPSITSAHTIEQNVATNEAAANEGRMAFVTIALTKGIYHALEHRAMAEQMLPLVPLTAPTAIVVSLSAVVAVISSLILPSIVNKMVSVNLAVLVGKMEMNVVSFAENFDQNVPVFVLDALDQTVEIIMVVNKHSKAQDEEEGDVYEVIVPRVVTNDQHRST